MSIGGFVNYEKLAKSEIVHLNVEKSESNLISNETNLIFLLTAVESMGDGAIIRNNLVTRVLWEGGYMGRRETTNFRYNGAFNLDKATNIILQNNHVGGAERLGFRTTGEPCSVSSINPWTGNVVHTALVGVALLPNNPLPGWFDNLFGLTL